MLGRGANNGGGALAAGDGGYGDGDSDRMGGPDAEGDVVGVE
jgi:hypothetical protein